MENSHSEELAPKKVSLVKCDPSDIYKHSYGKVCWSPDGNYVAVADTKRLLIRKKEQMASIALVFTCSDSIQHVEWSKDSQFILAAMYKRSMVQVFSLLHEDWNCKITEGIAGLIHATWTPDARHIITFSDFQLYLVIWSLLEKNTSYTIQHPKAGNEGVAFSPDGKFLAVLERKECKDFIGIYNCQEWALVRHFQLESYDAVEIFWSPENNVICVRDSHLEYRVLIYSIEGGLLEKYEAYHGALGLKSCCFSKQGKLLALGSYDQKVRVLNSITWRPIITYDHDINVRLKNAIHGYAEEKTEWLTNDDYQVTMVEYNRIPQMTIIAPDPNQPNPRHGISILSWSPNSKYLLSRNDCAPNTLWIWQLSPPMQLHSTVVLMDAVKSARWDPNPRHCRIAMCSVNGHVYIWTEEKIEMVSIPFLHELKPIGLRWHPDGEQLILLGKETFCSISL